MMSWSTTRFVLKHFVAAAVVIGALVACVAATYVALVLVAMARDTALAGPFASPATVLTGLAGGIGAVVLVLAPITIAAELACTRNRVNVWCQVPLSLAMLCLVGAGLAAVAVSSGWLLPTAVRVSAIATAALLIPLGIYWWALQSADWLLRRGGYLASRVWPSRFSALAPPLTVGGHALEVRATFRILNHLYFTVGARNRLIIVGDIESGAVRKGMRIFADSLVVPLTATIASVEYVDHMRPPESHVGLMLDAMSDVDVDRWKAAATEGRVLMIA